MTDHDPLCRYQGQPSHGACDCGLIVAVEDRFMEQVKADETAARYLAKARADERERIAAALEALAGRTTGYTHRRLIQEAARIARGDDRS